MPDVEVLDTVPESFRAQAGEVLWGGFSEKMVHVIGGRDSSQIMSRLIVPALINRPEI